MKSLAPVLVVLVVCLAATPALSAPQIPFEQATRDLASSDPNARLRAAQLLKAAAYPEAAVPLAPLVTDPEDEVQAEAIAAELNIFLAKKIVPRRRVGLVIEVRSKIAADAAFSGGPLALGPRPVPREVLAALLTATRDDNPRIALEAVYAFGTLAVAPAGAERRELLRTSGPVLAAMIGASDRGVRYAALRVMGRVFARRADDGTVEPTVGDAIVGALNDDDRGVRVAAMDALGAMRYDRAVQALTELFQYYGKGDLAEGALDALAHIAHPSSSALLEAALASRNDTFKISAIEGLARLGDRAKLADIQGTIGRTTSEAVLLAGSFASVMLSNAPVDPVVEALVRPALRDRAWQYVVELAPGRTSVFTRHTQDPDERIRLDVADALGMAGDPAALPVVEPLLRDRDPQVALAAQRAVARLRGGR